MVSENPTETELHLPSKTMRRKDALNYIISRVGQYSPGAGDNKESFIPADRSELIRLYAMLKEYRERWE